MTSIKLSSEKIGIPNGVLIKMLESLLKDDALITFHNNYTFLAIWDAYNKQAKTQVHKIAKFQAIYRRYLHKLVDFGYVEAGTFVGVGPGGYSMYGIRGYKHYHIVESERRFIERELQAAIDKLQSPSLFSTHKIENEILCNQITNTSN